MPPYQSRVASAGCFKPGCRPGVMYPADNTNNRENRNFAEHSACMTASSTGWSRWLCMESAPCTARLSTCASKQMVRRGPRHVCRALHRPSRTFGPHAHETNQCAGCAGRVIAYCLAVEGPVSCKREQRPAHSHCRKQHAKVEVEVRVRAAGILVRSPWVDMGSHNSRTRSIYSGMHAWPRDT